MSSTFTLYVRFLSLYSTLITTLFNLWDHVLPYSCSINGSRGHETRSHLFIICWRDTCWSQSHSPEADKDWVLCTRQIHREDHISLRTITFQDARPSTAARWLLGNMLVGFQGSPCYNPLTNMICPIPGKDGLYIKTGPWLCATVNMLFLWSIYSSSLPWRWTNGDFVASSRHLRQG